MTSEFEPRKEKDTTLSALNATIEVLNLAEEISAITPAKAVFGSVSILLAMVRVCFLAMQQASG